MRQPYKSWKFWVPWIVCITGLTLAGVFFPPWRRPNPPNNAYGMTVLVTVILTWLISYFVSEDYRN